MFAWVRLEVATGPCWWCWVWCEPPRWLHRMWLKDRTTHWKSIKFPRTQVGWGFCWWIFWTFGCSFHGSKYFQPCGILAHRALYRSEMLCRQLRVRWRLLLRGYKPYEDRYLMDAVVYNGQIFWFTLSTFFYVEIGKTNDRSVSRWFSFPPTGWMNLRSRFYGSSMSLRNFTWYLSTINWSKFWRKEYPRPRSMGRV